MANGTVVRTSYRPNPDGIVNLSVALPMRAAVHSAARAIGAVAQASAPVRTGDYASKFQTYVDETGTGRRRRARGVLRNASAHAAPIEFGNRRARGQRIMGRALAAAVASR